MATRATPGRPAPGELGHPGRGRLEAPLRYLGALAPAQAGAGHHGVAVHVEAGHVVNLLFHWAPPGSRSATAAEAGASVKEKLGFALAAALQGPSVPTPVSKRAQSTKVGRRRASAGPIISSAPRSS